MLHELHRSEKQYLVVKVGEKAKEIFTKLITNFEFVRLKYLKVFTSGLELLSCQWIKQLGPLTINGAGNWVHLPLSLYKLYCTSVG